MLSRWLHRGGLGQMLAPDPTFIEEEEKQEKTEFAGGIWDVLAPDPNFAGGSKSPNVKDTSSSTRVVVEDDLKLESYSTPDKGITSAHALSSTGNNNPKNESKVERQVLSAAKGLTESLLSPQNVWDDVNRFFTYCASTTELNEKKLKKVTKMLRKDPSLAMARASNMGNLVQNGFTPLHAAASAGNVEVAKILIDFTDEKKVGDADTTYHPVELDATDVVGRTALHVASEQGQMTMIRLLKDKMTERCGLEPIGENAPADLTGRTPLGWAVTSTAAKAKSNMGALRSELFSPGDKSIYGEKTPASVRTGGRKFGPGQRSALSVDLQFGFSDMPGHRVTMEDAICHRYPLIPPNRPNESVGFFGVFDGHGDGGISSNFIAENLINYITSSLEWETYDGKIEPIAQSMSQACIIADNDLKEKLEGGNSIQHGGSTGVMAIITVDSVLIGNVGDSRCILVQRESPSLDDNLSKEMEKMSTEEQLSKDEPASVSKKTIGEGIIVKALSTDHKPDILDEKTRIEKAGMEVIEEIFTIDGKVTRFAKIKKDDSNKIAVSRAFGDFDYKANEELNADEQAIICTPEITVHKRDHSNDMYLILACDGVYDVMSNDDVGNFVVTKAEELRKIVDADSVLAEVGDELLKKCLDLGSTDNMSVLIIDFPRCDQTDNTTRTLNFADV